ncbi:mechanosensitive ion channel family protein [Sphingomonas radiodurans]|uniref:mechanosensitive ion channel family protein n=1 Tax=Sphingomonas radiodurans TaxID=2890321 RepID=UPI001E357385|nr:mechanosensitive ion channel family protein [Sphingomonas radiodurans]WBH16184.1 mechanosensitive ion channel family protein [Sphingomonas radiodurans]
MTTNKSAAALPKISAGDVQQQMQTLWTSTSDWIGEHWLQVAIAAAIGTALALGLLWLRNLGPKLARRSNSGKGWAAIFGKAIQRTSTFFIVLVAAKLVGGYADPPVIVTTTINFLFTLAAVFQAATWARELILGAIEHRTRSENYSGEALMNAMGLIRLLVTIVVFAIALVVVLDNLGVNVTGLVAGLGVGGIAIGLAAQGIFADLFAALAIIFDRPFRRGDMIMYDTSSGNVEEIGLKSTRIRGVNGEERIISNKNLLDKEIVNNTRRDRRRTKLAIGVAYETDLDVLDRLPAMLQEVVEQQEQVFIRCGFVAYGASSLDFELEFDTPFPDFEHAYAARTKVGLAIYRRFVAEGINIPFPTQTTYTAAPDGRLVMPYAQVQPVHEVSGNSASDRIN